MIFADAHLFYHLPQLESPQKLRVHQQTMTAALVRILECGDHLLIECSLLLQFDRSRKYRGVKSGTYM